VRGRGEDEEEVKKDAPSLGFFRGESGKWNKDSSD
jgi:hypothetical protein